MKKILALSAFIVLGFVAANAQNPTTKKQTQPVSMAPENASTQVLAPAATTDVVSTDAKKEAKKECSAEEKKACNSKSGKKSCCSSKSDLKKEDGK